MREVRLNRRAARGGICRKAGGYVLEVKLPLGSEYILLIRDVQKSGRQAEQADALYCCFGSWWSFSCCLFVVVLGWRMNGMSWGKAIGGEICGRWEAEGKSNE